LQKEEKERLKKEQESSSDSEHSKSSDNSDSDNSSDSSEFKGRRKKRQTKRDSKKTQWELDLEKRHLDPKKVKACLEKLDEDIKTKGQASAQFISIDASKPITAEELEAYRLSRQMFGDPMRQL